MTLEKREKLAAPIQPTAQRASAERRQNAIASPLADDRGLLFLLLQERVCNLLRSIDRADHHDGGASCDGEPEVARLIRQLVGIIRIAHELLRIVQHQIDKRIVTLQNAGH